MQRSLDTFEKDLLAARPMLYNFAMGLVRRRHHMAEDLVQETMVKAIAHRGTYQDGTKFEAWLVTILRNLHYSQWRKAKREVEDPENVVATNTGVFMDPINRMVAVDTLQRLKDLPEQFRKVLWLVADGATYEDIADEMEISVGTVKSRANRARSMLTLGVQNP